MRNLEIPTRERTNSQQSSRSTAKALGGDWALETLSCLKGAAQRVELSSSVGFQTPGHLTSALMPFGGAPLKVVSWGLRSSVGVIARVVNGRQTVEPSANPSFHRDLDAR